MPLAGSLNLRKAPNAPWRPGAEHAVPLAQQPQAQAYMQPSPGMAPIPPEERAYRDQVGELEEMKSRATHMRRKIAEALANR